MKASLALLSALLISCASQRSPYAGRYPSVVTPAPVVDPLANKFGEDTPTTTMRLPIEALGDAELVKRMMKLPIDQQPFWLINWQALEANRAMPQTYELKNNIFIDLGRN